MRGHAPRATKCAWASARDRAPRPSPLSHIINEYTYSNSANARGRGGRQGNACENASPIYSSCGQPLTLVVMAGVEILAAYSLSASIFC